MGIISIVLLSGKISANISMEIISSVIDLLKDFIGKYIYEDHFN